MSRRFATRTAAVSDLRWAFALGVLYILLVIPDNPWAFDPTAILYFPWELILISLLPAAMPERAWRFFQPLVTAAITLILVIKVANIAVLEGFDRPFAPLADMALIPTALGTLAKNSIFLAAGAVVATLAVILLLAAGVRWSLSGLARAVQRTGWHAVTMGLIIIAAVLAPFSLSNSPSPLATAATTLLVRDQVKALIADMDDTAAFRRDLDKPAPPPSLTNPRAIDVVVIFIESYGRNALERDPQAGIVRPVLDQSAKTLADAGYSLRSAWAQSPTFGGESWLAHSTAMSGLWVTTQARYHALTGSHRSTLIGDFKQAGWRTTAFLPEITDAWPERNYFGFNSAYTAPEIGYQGPPFGYMTMPDQFVLHAFNTREFAKTDRAPLLAEIALVSSHIPWAPIPKLIPWSDVGNGEIFASARSKEDAAAAWHDPARIPVFYGQSIAYVLQTLTSFITTYGRDNTLFILVGDHQPMSFIAGDAASHDVPLHVIARDETLLRALDTETWATGLAPAQDGPVIKMDTLRARITQAFTAR